MVIGISLATTTGLTAGIIHLFNQALLQGALFLALGCIVFRLNSVELRDLAGMGRRMPWTMAAFVAGGLSLIGVPATVGFISKWYLVLAALERDWWWLAFMVVASSLLAVLYIWRVVETAYFKAGPDGNTKEAPLTLLVPTWILIAANIYFGVHAVDTVSFATRAAEQLLGSF